MGRVGGVVVDVNMINVIANGIMQVEQECSGSLQGPCTCLLDPYIDAWESA
jgi:hypothetical protein